MGKGKYSWVFVIIVLIKILEVTVRLTNSEYIVSFSLIGLNLNSKTEFRIKLD